MSKPKLPLLSRFLPWYMASEHIRDSLSAEETDTKSMKQWRDSKLSELTVVNITGALIAGVVSSAFSWPTIDSSPWTTKALFDSALILALVSVVAGSQQSIALYRIGGHRKGLPNLQKLLKKPSTTDPSRLQLYVWQMPIMLLNVSILLFLVGFMISIWNRAAAQPSWDQDMKVLYLIFPFQTIALRPLKFKQAAFVASIAGLYALINYVIGTFSLYRMNSPSDQENNPATRAEPPGSGCGSCGHRTGERGGEREGGGGREGEVEVPHLLATSSNVVE